MLLSSLSYFLLILGSSSRAQFTGNRTHFPSLKPRPEAATADPNFEETGRGIVNILNPYSRSVAPNTKSLQQQRSVWALQNNLRILYRTYNEAETYDDYVDQVNLACNFSETTSFDIIWVNSTMTGGLANCLLDLYAWDFSIAGDQDKSILSNSIVDDRLVSLPFESSLGFMARNNDFIKKYQITTLPNTLDEIEQFCTTILQGERTMDNWKVSCITGPFSDLNELSLLTLQWIAASNGTLFKGLNITVASSEVADILARIAAWTESGIVDGNDFKHATLQSSFDRFKNGMAVFLFGSTFELNSLIRDPPSFDWGITPFPGTENRFFGTLGGWSLGVYKFSKNPAAAVKTIKWITSKDAQKSAILLSDPVKLLPTRKELYSDDEVCKSLSFGICDEFGKVEPVAPPSPLVKKNYYKMSFLIGTAIYSILNGNIDVAGGLENLYLSLRTSLSLNGTFTKIEIPVRPVKRGFKYLTLQVWILLIFCTTSVTMAVAFRLWYLRQVRLQKLRDEEEAQRLGKSSLKEDPNEGVELSPMGGSYKFRKLDDDEVDDERFDR